MGLKEKARESFTYALEKENTGINIRELSDRDLRSLYTKLQHLQQGKCKYWMPKGYDFKECLPTKGLQYVAFRNTPGVRPLTFAEYLKLEEFHATNPQVYPFFTPLGKYI